MSAEGRSGTSAVGDTARQQQQLGPGKEHTNSDQLVGAAGEAQASFRCAQPMFVPEAQPTSDPSGAQQGRATVRW
jgi:hypothetical protein